MSRFTSLSHLLGVIDDTGESRHKTARALRFVYRHRKAHEGLIRALTIRQAQCEQPGRLSRSKPLLTLMDRHRTADTPKPDHGSRFGMRPMKATHPLAPDEATRLKRARRNPMDSTPAKPLARYVWRNVARMNRAHCPKCKRRKKYLSERMHVVLDGQPKSLKSSSLVCPACSGLRRAA